MIADADLCYYASKFCMSSWCEIMPKMLEFWISQQYNILTKIYLRSPMFFKRQTSFQKIYITISPKKVNSNFYDIESNDKQRKFKGWKF